jgi:hypothetical protein
MALMLQSRSRVASLPKSLARALRLVHSGRWGEIRQRGDKRVIAFAGEGHFDPSALISNTFDIDWPPRTGRRQSFPEVDRACQGLRHKACSRGFHGNAPPDQLYSSPSLFFLCAFSIGAFRAFFEAISPLSRSCPVLLSVFPP